MKLNLFNGIIVFEGSVSELRAVMSDMDTMTPKLVDLQLKTNSAVAFHQGELVKVEAEKAKIVNGQRAPGYQQ
jgi:hypothetical protein